MVAAVTLRSCFRSTSFGTTISQRIDAFGLDRGDGSVTSCQRPAPTSHDPLFPLYAAPSPGPPNPHAHLSVCSTRVPAPPALLLPYICSPHRPSRNTRLSSPSLKMHALPSARPRPSQMPTEDPGSSTSPTTSSPASFSPLTPPPILPPRQKNIYEFSTLAYNGVRYSMPIRSRAISLSPPSTRGAAMLPIGKPSPPQASERPLKKTLPTGLGLVDLEKLASAPSPHADASREERAQRRRAVHFHSHAHFSEALRFNLARPDATRIAPEQLHLGEWSAAGASHRDGGGDEEDYSWEAEDRQPDGDNALTAPFSPNSSVRDLAAAFPSPPKSTPEFPLSLSSGFELEGPPDMPLPPTPPFVGSPHIFASIAYTNDPHDNRLTVIDPDMSMAQLEESMAKLETYNPEYNSGCFFDDDDEEEEEDDEAIESENGQSDYESSARSPALHTIGEDPREAQYTGAYQEEQSRQQEQPEEPVERQTHCITPNTFARVGFTSHGSISSVASQSSFAEEVKDGKPSPPPVDLLPRFDFERVHRGYNPQSKGHRRRSSSLTDLHPHLHVHWDDQPQASSRPSDSSGSSYSTRGSVTADSHASKSAIKTPWAPVSPPGGLPGSKGSAERLSRGIQAGDGHVSARPESPLRKTKSVPFIRRPVRQVQTTADQAPTPPTKPPRHPRPSRAPPAPPLPTSLSLASRTSHSLCHPTARPRSRPRADPPRTPPNHTEESGEEGLKSFMHITPEQNASRVSRLWKSARAGATLKREKSMRWLRGSVLQPRSEG